MTMRIPSLCRACKHFNENWSCDAYPQPNSISLDPFDLDTHFEVRSDQVGDAIFELNPDEELEFEAFMALKRAVEAPEQDSAPVEEVVNNDVETPSVGNDSELAGGNGDQTGIGTTS